MKKEVSSKTCNSVEVIYENKEAELKILKCKNGFFNILLKGKKIFTPDSRSAFLQANPFPNKTFAFAIRVKSLDNTEMLFIIKSLSWFCLDGCIFFFKKIFIFGNEVLASVNGEPLKYHHLKSADL